MHARELVEMAAIIASHGPAMMSGRGHLSATGMEHYWAASKCRIQRWTQALRHYSAGLERGRNTRSTSEFILATIEEILTGELLTRVWTAVSTGVDRKQRVSEMEPVSRSILMAHLEVRNRAMTLAMNPDAFDTSTAIEVNRLRKRVERWTDLLIAHLLAAHDVSEFASSPERAKEFADDLVREGRGGAAEQVWNLTLASLRACFQSELSPLSPNGDLNESIASSILASFPSTLFDSTGMFNSLWLTRMVHTTDDAQGMIEELLACSAPHRDLTQQASTALLGRRNLAK